MILLFCLIFQTKIFNAEPLTLFDLNTKFENLETKTNNLEITNAYLTKEIEKLKNRNEELESFIEIKEIEERLLKKCYLYPIKTSLISFEYAFGFWICNLRRLM